jgi:rhodanese-related sulfurtransferase
MVAPVRGARIVLADDDGVRANMTASWLAQMSWEVHVLDDLQTTDFSESGLWSPSLPPLPHAHRTDPATLANWLAKDEAVVLDLSPSSSYIKGHIPGAWFVLRSLLQDALKKIPSVNCYVLTCTTGTIAGFVAAELSALVAAEVLVLDGGNDAWRNAGFTLEVGPTRLASTPIDRYRRPYEGTDNPREAMQAYLDWEFGLVAQLERDGTHGFRVI